MGIPVNSDISCFSEILLSIPSAWEIADSLKTSKKALIFLSILLIWDKNVLVNSTADNSLSRSFLWSCLIVRFYSSILFIKNGLNFYKVIFFFGN